MWDICRHFKLPSTSPRPGYGGNLTGAAKAALNLFNAGDAKICPWHVPSGESSWDVWIVLWYSTPKNYAEKLESWKTWNIFHRNNQWHVLRYFFEVVLLITKEQLSIVYDNLSLRISLVIAKYKSAIYG